MTPMMETLTETYLFWVQEQPVLVLILLLCCCALFSVLNLRKLLFIIRFAVKKKRAQEELIHRYVHYQH